MHPETLRRRIGAEKWIRPEGAPKAPEAVGGKTAGMRRLANSMADAGMVQARILRAVDRQIGKVDARLRKKGTEVEERDSHILGNLAKTLGALMNTGSGGTTSKDVERPNRAEVEARLAERIRRWARGEEGSDEFLHASDGCRAGGDRQALGWMRGRTDQKAPEGDWLTWLILGGRGAGKTRSGAEFVRGLALGLEPFVPTASDRSRWSAKPMPTCAR